MTRQIAEPYLLFLADVQEPAAAKTAAGIADWCRDKVVGQLRLPACRVDLELPDLTVPEAVARGARTLVIGVAPAGGALSPAWLPTIRASLEAGLDVAAGLHARLNDLTELKALADGLGRRLIDVRHPPRSFQVGSGLKRSGRRVLTVGTDCVVGKKYTALALTRELRGRGIDVDFRATGQTGIFIAGDGIAVDAVVADFVSGAAEWLSPAASDDHWDVIEGQGTLLHPAYAGVTMGLVHGSQPDAIIVCHQPGRRKLVGFEHPVPDLVQCIDRHVEAARLTNPACRAVGVSLYTKGMDEQEVANEMMRITRLTGLPCADPIRHGLAPVADYMLADAKATLNLRTL